MGSAAAFMITGPATKITNLGALKIAMGWKRFALYIGFVMLFSFLCGMIVNLKNLCPSRDYGNDVGGRVVCIG
jgi:uncharacterized membrane protein YraQ (UPF0718 family)